MSGLQPGRGSDLPPPPRPDPTSSQRGNTTLAVRLFALTPIPPLSSAHSLLGLSTRYSLLATRYTLPQGEGASASTPRSGGAWLRWSETDSSGTKGELRLTAKASVELRRGELRIREGAVLLVIREADRGAEALAADALSEWHDAICAAAKALASTSLSK